MVVAISTGKLVTGAALLSNVTWEILEKLDADMAGTGARLTYAKVLNLVFYHRYPQMNTDEHR
ncbi:MAG TPA: hypothetical protein V6D28_23795 [Leptolyngbyaceae cyanobacterium]